MTNKSLFCCLVPFKIDRCDAHVDDGDEYRVDHDGKRDLKELLERDLDPVLFGYARSYKITTSLFNQNPNI